MDIGHTVKSVVTGMPSMFIGGKPGERAGDQRMAQCRPELAGAGQIAVRSDAFGAGGDLPARFSAKEGQNIAPPLSWSGAPDGTASLVLIVEDPDAPTPEPFVHWLLYNIPAGHGALPEAIRPEPIAPAAGGAMQGKNSNLQLGWTGMAPPEGDVPHHYHFQLFALDRRLPLDPGAGRAELIEAMGGHVLAFGELVGTYQR